MEKVTKPIVLNETFSEKLNVINTQLSSIAQSCKTISADVPKVTTGTSSDGSTTITVINKDGTTTTELVDGTARTSVNSLSNSVSTRMSEFETEQAAQDARMDTFVALQNGSTTGDAELADIRVGANGTTYNSAGSAVRGQIGELKSDLAELSETTDVVLSVNRTYTNTSTGYSELAKGLSFKKGYPYMLEWIALTPLSSTKSYYYLTDSDGNNIDLGDSLIDSSKGKVNKLFVPNKDLFNITSRIYTQDVGIVWNFIVKPVCDNNKIAQLKLSNLREIKSFLPFGVGDISDGKFRPNLHPYRVSNIMNVVFDEDIKVTLSDGYRFGWCTFDTIEQETTSKWSGWIEGSVTIPKNTVFKLQCARKIEETSSIIEDAYNNDIYNNMSICAVDGEFAALEHRIDNIEFFEYGHNGIKCEVFQNYAVWSQGCAKVGNTFVGFNASNDEHTDTGTYTSMYYENGYVYNARGEHNLGHCASADYCEETDTLIVANGTYAGGVTPTIYFIGNAKNITNNGTGIMVTDSNVFAIELTNLDGGGVVCCYGENSSIVYAMTTENASNYSEYGKKYLYKLVLGMGAKNMVSLHPNDSIGTFVSGKSDNEYNGTAYVVKKYIGDYKVELQGMKYHKGKIILSSDTIVDNVQTAYILAIRTVDNDNSFVVENSYWIPSLDADGNYTRTESEGVVFADGYGYVTIFRSVLGDSRTFKFEW